MGASSGAVRGAARVIAEMAGGERLEDEDGSPRTGWHHGDVLPVGAAQRSRTVVPLQPDGIVALRQDAQHLTRFPFVDVAKSERHYLRRN